MHPIDFLNDDLVDLPHSHGGDYSQFISDLFSCYVRHVDSVERHSLLGRSIASKRQVIENLCNELQKILRLALVGDHDAAYNLLNVTLATLGAHFNALCPTGDMSQFVDPMYRFRVSSQPTLQRKDLFHIPFELPNRIGSMRYSLAGKPCLYLGGSTHVCWRELGEPALDSVVVSRFRAVPATNLRVLNFGHRLPLLAAWVDAEPVHFSSNTPEMAVVLASVTCWPLVAICSIRVPDRSVLVRPEYLIPQLVLEWIMRTRSFHGVRYFSTHYEEYPDNPKTYMNYAFPARTSAATGYCSELTQLFELTEPKQWYCAKALPPSIADRPIYKKREQILRDLEDEFGQVEDGLFGLPVGMV